MPKIEIRCEICGTHVAAAQTQNLSVPLTGAMLLPPTDWIPRSIPEEATWQYMRCPMCLKRPFIIEGRFQLVDHSYFDCRKPGDLFWSGVTGTQETFGEAKPVDLFMAPGQTVTEAPESAPVQPAPPAADLESTIYALADEGLSISEIAKRVGIHHGAVTGKLRKRGM